MELGGTSPSYSLYPDSSPEPVLALAREGQRSKSRAAKVQSVFLATCYSCQVTSPAAVNLQMQLHHISLLLLCPPYCQSQSSEDVGCRIGGEVQYWPGMPLTDDLQKADLSDHGDCWPFDFGKKCSKGWRARQSMSTRLVLKKTSYKACHFHLKPETFENVCISIFCLLFGECNTSVNGLTASCTLHIIKTVILEKEVCLGPMILNEMIKASNLT